MKAVCSACDTAWCNCCHWGCGGERVERDGLEERVRELEGLVRTLLTEKGATATGWTLAL